MYEIIKKKKLTETEIKMEIKAPFVSKKAEPGQFVIIRTDDNGERIPLTIAGYNREKETVSIIFQTVGATTSRLAEFEEGDCLLDFAGPLGKASDCEEIKKVCAIGGGIGNAAMFPIAKKMHDLGTEVTAIIGFRNKDSIILENEYIENTDRLYVVTNDGSYGENGFVTDMLAKLLKSGEKFDEVIAVGPLVMMKAVSKVTKDYNIKTIVSMNPIMVDGTGMCGACRLTVDGETKFACIDGPDFDGHKVDFDEIINRNSMYRDFEKKSRDKNCNLLKKEVQ